MVPGPGRSSQHHLRGTEELSTTNSGDAVYAAQISRRSTGYDITASKAQHLKSTTPQKHNTSKAQHLKSTTPQSTTPQKHNTSKAQHLKAQHLKGTPQKHNTSKAHLKRPPYLYLVDGAIILTGINPLCLFSSFSPRNAQL